MTQSNETITLSAPSKGGYSAECAADNDGAYAVQYSAAYDPDFRADDLAQEYAS